MIHPQEQIEGFGYANCNRRDWRTGHRNSGISILGTDEGGVKNEYSITVCAVCVSQGTVLVDTRSCAFIAEIGQTCFHEQTLVMDMFPKSHLMAVLG